jgi:hypothetical protein
VRCDAARRALEARFTLAEEPVDDAALDAHLHACAECRAYADQLARVDAALEGGALGPGRVEALEARLLARLGAAPPSGVPAPPRARWWPWAVVAAVMVTAMVLVAGLARFGPADDYTPRGGEAEVYGVRAFCVGATGAVVAEARAGETLPCARGDLVQFTYTSPTPVRLSVTLEGTQTQLFPGEGASDSLEAGVDVPLPSSTPVGDWLEGSRRVVVRFSSEDGGVRRAATLTLRPAP